jgi:hypothetical protein
MATLYFGVVHGGQGPGDVSTSASTTSRDIELAVDDSPLTAGGIGKKDALVRGVKAILQAVEEYDL